jgi:hypothetical protein
MARTARRVIATALVLVLVTACDPGMSGPAPFVLAYPTGYKVTSACGEGITKVTVSRVNDQGGGETYWIAEAHPEDASNEVTLFALNPGYSVTQVAGAMKPGADYDVQVNGGSGTSIVVGQLRSGQGAWLSDTFDLTDLAAEQAKAKDQVC